MLGDITPEHDSKLQMLIDVIRKKFANPINGDNRKVIVFIAFSDTAQYIYDNIAPLIKERTGLNPALVSGDDNPLSIEEQGDLKYRRDQLEGLKEEVVDIEEMNTGGSIMDLGLNEFCLDLLEYMRSGIDIEHTPMGLHAITTTSKDAPKGVIFVLKNRNNDKNIAKKNRLHPFYMVYISQDSEVIVNHLDPKGLLDRMRQLCRGKSEPIAELCRKFNAETRDGNAWVHTPDFLVMLYLHL